MRHHSHHARHSFGDSKLVYDEENASADARDELLKGDYQMPEGVESGKLVTLLNISDLADVINRCRRAQTNSITLSCAVELLAPLKKLESEVYNVLRDTRQAVQEDRDIKDPDERLKLLRMPGHIVWAGASQAPLDENVSTSAASRALSFHGDECKKSRWQIIYGVHKHHIVTLVGGTRSGKGLSPDDVGRNPKLLEQYSRVCGEDKEVELLPDEKAVLRVENGGCLKNGSVLDKGWRNVVPFKDVSKVTRGKISPDSAADLILGVLDHSVAQAREFAKAYGLTLHAEYKLSGIPDGTVDYSPAKGASDLDRKIGEVQKEATKEERGRSDRLVNNYDDLDAIIPVPRSSGFPDTIAGRGPRGRKRKSSQDAESLGVQFPDDAVAGSMAEALNTGIEADDSPRADEAIEHQSDLGDPDIMVERAIQKSIRRRNRNTPRDITGTEKEGGTSTIMASGLSKMNLSDSDLFSAEQRAGYGRTRQQQQPEYQNAKRMKMSEEGHYKAVGGARGSERKPVAPKSRRGHHKGPGGEMFRK